MMKNIVYLLALLLVVGVASAGYISHGWSSPVVVRRVVYAPVRYGGGWSGYGRSGGYGGGGWSGYGRSGWSGGYGGWKGGWSGGYGGWKGSYGGWNSGWW